MIKNEFEPYDVAFALKELGFDKSTLVYYQEHNKERKTKCEYITTQTYNK